MSPWCFAQALLEINHARLADSDQPALRSVEVQDDQDDQGDQQGQDHLLDGRPARPKSPSEAAEGNGGGPAPTEEKQGAGGPGLVSAALGFSLVAVNSVKD